MMKLKKFKNGWLVTLCVLILVISAVGVVNAATVQPGQSYQQAMAEWIKNDPNPMTLNMNTNLNADPATGATLNTNNNNAQPGTDNSSQPAANTTGQNSQQPANGSQSTGQTPAPANQNDLYNQMLKACLQVGGQMMQNCPILNGSDMTQDQMIKFCLQMNGHMISQQDIAAMQLACQQFYQPGQKNVSNSMGTQNGNTYNGNGWGRGNMSGNRSNMANHGW